MPTGYTAPVQRGEVTEFNEFAMRCARAFGALIEMREAPSSAPIPAEFAPSSYHEKAVTEARERLSHLKSLNAEQRAAAANAEHTDALASWDRYEADKATSKLRYEAMLAKAREWTPPTPDHSRLKKFMVDQLIESISFDCSTSYSKRPEPKTADEWFEASVADCLRNIEYHTKENENEIERARTRTAWVADLRKSLAANQ